MTTGVGCHFLLQGIFPTQGSPALLADSLLARPPGKPRKGVNSKAFSHLLKPQTSGVGRSQASLLLSSEASVSGLGTGCPQISASCTGWFPQISTHTCFCDFVPFRGARGEPECLPVFRGKLFRLQPPSLPHPPSLQSVYCLLSGCLQVRGPVI